jgi:hypothetical protein
MIHGGINTLEFAGTTDATFANAQITAWLYVPWTQTAAGKTETTVPGKSFGLGLRLHLRRSECHCWPADRLHRERAALRVTKAMA